MHLSNKSLSLALSEPVSTPHVKPMPQSLCDTKNTIVLLISGCNQLDCLLLLSITV